jgi:hypothetical protein
MKQRLGSVPGKSHRKLFKMAGIGRTLQSRTGAINQAQIVVREECRSNCEISRSGVDIVLDFAGRRVVQPRFLAFWDFAFCRFVIP